MMLSRTFLLVKMSILWYKYHLINYLESMPGIHVDNTISWKTHITHLCSKLRSRLYIYNQVKYLMPLSIRKQYFSCLVQPVMDYECVTLGNCNRDLLIKMHNMMKMYARSILDITYKRQSSSVNLFQTSGWMPVDVHINYFFDFQIYNIIHGNVPSYLNEMFKTNRQIHSYNIRNNKCLYLPKYNLVTRQRTFKFRWIKLWDNPTNNIKVSLSLDSSKSKFKTMRTSDLYEFETFSLDLPHFFQEYVTFSMCMF